MPFTVVSFVAAVASGNLSAKVPARFLLAGGLLLTGIGLMLMRGLTVDSDWTALLAGFIVAGAGVGLINPALASTAIGVVPPQRSGMASGINSTFRQVGIATGIAILGAIFESGLANKLAPGPRRHARGRIAPRTSRTPSRPAAPVRSLASVPPGQRAHAAAAIHGAFAGTMNDILLVAGDRRLHRCDPHARCSSASATSSPTGLRNPRQSPNRRPRPASWPSRATT